MANLPATIDTYEEGVARFFRWRTGLDYYLTIDQIVDFVVNTGRVKRHGPADRHRDIRAEAGGAEAFAGRIYSFDTNITLLERAKQRAAHLNLQSIDRVQAFAGASLPRCRTASAIWRFPFFDLHRHPAEQYLAEILRILVPERAPDPCRNAGRRNRRRNSVSWLV